MGCCLQIYYLDHVFFCYLQTILLEVIENLLIKLITNKIILIPDKTDFCVYMILYLDESELQPVYGCPLEDHLRIQEREIAFVIEECVTFLYREAMDVQVSLLSFNHFRFEF